ncbi:MAG: hypothetical protein ACFFBD_06825 [Candidatus Hodarchaeota archaeon]
MTKNPSIGTLKSDWEGEEERFILEETPIDRDTIGRPTWWLTGSLFVPKTGREKKLAMLQYQTLARANPVLSFRAQRIRQCISVLSQWFPLPLLDEVGKEILIETDLRQNDETLFAHFLGVLEFFLRQRHCTISWAVLQEINQTIGYYLEKKDIYKWLFYTRQRKKVHAPDTLRLVQHLTIAQLSQASLSAEQKRRLCQKTVQMIKILRNKGFICKDPEIASWTLKRILLEEKGSQTSIPKELRSVTTRMTSRIRKLLEK